MRDEIVGGVVISGGPVGKGSHDLSVMELIDVWLVMLSVLLLSVRVGMGCDQSQLQSKGAPMR